LSESAATADATARTVGDLLRWAAAKIVASNGEARADALVLLEATAGIGAAQAYGRPELAVPAAAVRTFERAVTRRAEGEPVAYIVGTRGFHALDLDVSEHVLIPRPETEILVDAVLERAPHGEPVAVLDLGTGSGAIALAIAHALPSASVCGVDASPAALGVARANSHKLGLDVEWILSDWYAALAGRRFDFIVSNPPYVCTNDPHMAALRYEPRVALDGGPDGLAALRQVLSSATAHLLVGGTVLVEHGFDQAARVAELAELHDLAVCATVIDGGGHERVTIMQAAS
jgi:release factor glutamine methyltransferase